MHFFVLNAAVNYRHFVRFYLMSFFVFNENGNRYQYTTSLGIEGTKEGPIFKELFEMLKEDPHEWKAFIKNLAA